MPTLTSLAALAATIEAMGKGHMSITHSVTQIQTQYQALAELLPERFQTVLDEILDRLQAGALFTEESCSFSQSDLQAHLALWLAKVQQSLASQS